MALGENAHRELTESPGRKNHKLRVISEALLAWYTLDFASILGGAQKSLHGLSLR